MRFLRLVYLRANSSLISVPFERRHGSMQSMRKSTMNRRNDERRWKNIYCGVRETM